MKKFLFFILVSTLLLATSIYFTFKWGSEWISSLVADIVPIEIQKQMGEYSLKSLEAQGLEESRLSLFTQRKIQRLFNQMLEKDSANVHLIFKHAAFPNAFALPGNSIVLLDSLVNLSQDTVHYSDVLGVLAHEAGHLHYKHSLKLLIKSGLTAAVVGYFIGDYSAFLASLTHQLFSLSYSRAYEEQADDFAIQLLKQHRISTLPLAQLLENISKDTEHIPAFLSTHPVTKERVKKLKGE